MLFRRKRRAWFWRALGGLVTGLFMFAVAGLFHGAVSREPKIKVPGTWRPGDLLEKALNWLFSSA